MNAENVVKILTLLQAEYPNSFSRLDERQMKLKMELWIKEFEADEYKLVYASVRILMRENREFAPNIGQIREKMRLLTAPDELSEADAWTIVSKACRNGLYGYAQEYAKLPEDVQRAVGAPEQLREWAMMDADTLQSVVASNFRRSYRVYKSRQKELAMIPSELRAALLGASGSMKLIEAQEDHQS